jgi:16S rRNA (cytosine1402-N4)-methyltransferase
MEHQPALLKEVIELLQPRPGSVFVDCTVGGAGHALAFLERIQPGGRLLALDRDSDAVERVERRLGPGAIVRHADFAELEQVGREAGFDAVDAVFFDLGVSSHQLDEAERGFSFRNPGPLDMRMDTSAPLTARTLVNQASQPKLAAIIRELGQERWAARIAEFIVKRRPLATTSDLAAAVEAAIPRAAWPRDIHPATRTFQAIRMAVNDELGSLETGLKAALKILSPGGRMAAISFHSLEDSLVKSFFRAESTDCLCPPQQPVCTCAHRASLRLLTKRPITPSPEEVERNPRARSARLRAAEKL